MNRKMGPPTVLSESEESRIVNCILAKARVGCPIHPETLKD
ncbi:HTH psq-type domain-containing protein, partial [Aphis craccivora]